MSNYRIIIDILRVSDKGIAEMNGGDFLITPEVRLVSKSNTKKGKHYEHSLCESINSGTERTATN